MTAEELEEVATLLTRILDERDKILVERVADVVASLTTSTEAEATS
ncbi:MAG: hypothetical protein M3O92_00310 [Actinomycetota bacterium]|nr:hypothetical protein [Actinomycetota bacterium]